MELTEWDTRLIPYAQVEASYANNRPLAERPPIPRVGDPVYYRREYWDQHPVEVRVVWVQSLEERDDPNLWRIVRDTDGVPITDFGVVRRVRVPDPWPLVRVRGVWEVAGITCEREALTRESRMRGSPGWLPLSWRWRPVRLPSELLSAPRPELTPANVQYSDFVRFGGS